MNSDIYGKYIKLIDKFSVAEKILARTGFYGFIIIGAYGIYSQSILWGIAYTLFVLLGSIFGLPYYFCSHCPYPYKYSDCLFTPFWLIARQQEFRPGQLTISDKICSAVIGAGLVLIPQYWLFKNHSVLILFWIFCALTLVSFPIYYCKRCRNFKCPFNSVSKELRRAEAGK
jgi:hypothetical protein